jgi:hypothetical protein
VQEAGNGMGHRELNRKEEMSINQPQRPQMMSEELFVELGETIY